MTPQISLPFSFSQSSHSVTPLYPPKPDLTMSSAVVPDLLETPDLLDWAGQNGYPSVTSYTEAGLANRLVVRLKGGGAGKATLRSRIITIFPRLLWFVSNNRIEFLRTARSIATSSSYPCNFLFISFI